MKGQVTAFVILGLVILAIGVTVFTFRQEIMSSLTGSQLEENIVVPPQAERAKLYVDTCIDTLTTQGLAVIGAQGGYVTPPQKNLPNLVDPFGSSLDVFGKGAGSVAFWFTEAANGVEQDQTPTKKQIETDLAAYIDDNLPSCVNDFKALRAQGYGFNLDAAHSTAIINEKNVIIQTSYPITVNKEDFTFTFTDFKRTITSRFGELYRNAVEIMQKESTDYFLENRALDMMSIYDTIPFSGIDTACVPKTWLKTNVQKQLKTIFAANYPSLRVDNSQYHANVKDAKSFTVDALSKKTDASILFSYNEQWPLLMDVVGENEEILRGKPFTAENAASRFLLPLFCLNDNHFVYDVKFPMLISLQEGDSMFQFATLVSIDNNQPRENRVTPVVTDLQDDICQAAGKEFTVVAAAYNADNSLVEVPNARISYKCLNQICNRGETQADAHGAAIKTTFPQCSDGVMMAEKEGYHTGETPVSTNLASGEIIVYMEPLTDVEANIQVIDNQQERTPYQTEQILVTLDNQEKKYSTSFIYPTEKKVSLIPGDYIVTTQIMVDNAGGFNFPEKEIELCNDVPQNGVLGIAGLTTRKCTKQKMDATTLDQIVGGGSTTSWSIPRPALAGATKVTFYTVRGPTPRSLDEIGKVYEAVQQQNNGVKKPVLE